jgi:hypothetical protein
VRGKAISPKPWQRDMSPNQKPKDATHGPGHAAMANSPGSVDGERWPHGRRQRGLGGVPRGHWPRCRKKGDWEECPEGTGHAAEEKGDWEECPEGTGHAAEDKGIGIDGVMGIGPTQAGLIAGRCMACASTQQAGRLKEHPIVKHGLG